MGATLYHLLTGVKPPDALTRASAVRTAKRDLLQPANEIHAAVGPELSTILQRALALNPADRFKSAHEFRDVLRRLGRDEVRALSDWTESHAAETLNVPHMNMTVVRKPPVFDPFDSYSILKPAEGAWLLPKTSRRPIMIASFLGLLLLGTVYAFTDFGQWIDSSKAISDFVQAGSPKTSEAVVTRQIKAEKPRGSATISNSSTTDMKNARRGRRTRQANSSNSSIVAR